MPLLTPAADGTFDFGPYPAGRYSLSVRRQQALLLRAGPVDIAPDQTYDFGDLRVE